MAYLFSYYLNLTGTLPQNHDGLLKDKQQFDTDTLWNIRRLWYKWWITCLPFTWNIYIYKYANTVELLADYKRITGFLFKTINKEKTSDAISDKLPKEYL